MGRLKALLSNPASQIEVQAALVTAVLEDEAAETGALDTTIGNFVPDAISSVAVESSINNLIIADVLPPGALASEYAEGLTVTYQDGTPGITTYGIFGFPYTTQTEEKNGSVGVAGAPYNKGSGTLDQMMGVAGYVGNYGGTVTDGIALRAWNSDTNTYGGLTAKPFVNLYGLYIDDQAAGGNATNYYPIYSPGADTSMFFGPIETPLLKSKTIYTAAGTPIPAAGAGLKGTRAFVGDSTAAAVGGFGAAYVSGGTHTVPVWCDGTSWLIG